LLTFPLAEWTQSIDSHEFYRVIPNECVGSYEISSLFQISPFGRDDMPQTIISVS